MRDLYNEILPTPIINPAAIVNGNGTTTSSIIDLDGYESIVFAVQSGAITDGSLTLTLYHDDAVGMGTETAVSASDLLGTATAFADTDDNEIHYFGYRGNKRYLRLKVVQAGAAVGAYFSAFAIKGNSHIKPIQ